jgi:hypothetical protein
MAKRKQLGQNRYASEKKRLQAIYAKSRAEFTAADLQKYTETDQGIPIEKVLTELEAAHRKLARKKR